MKKLSYVGAIKAFTLVELLVVIAIIAILFAVLQPAIDNKPMHAPLINCMSNLKQSDLGFIMWASDNHNQFPWQVSSTNGGTMESIPGGHVFPHFQIPSSSYVKNLSVLVCPTDKIKTTAIGYDGLTDTNISYFINLDATTNTSPSLTVLSGDRHLEANGQPVKPGLFVLTTNSTMGWTLELHGNNRTAPVGVLAFVDGHVQSAVTKSLPALFQNQGLATNRLVVP